MKSIIKYKHLLWFLAVLCCLQLIGPNASYSQECVSNDITSNSTDELATKYIKVLKALGPFNAGTEVVTKENDEFIIDQENAGELLKELKLAFCWTKKIATLSYLRYTAVNDFFNDRNEFDAFDWHNYFSAYLTEKTNLPSPNFEKRTYWIASLHPLGAIAPYGENEGYSASYDLTVGRTIARKSETKDRRFRFSLGVRQQHQLKKNDILGLVVVDWKVSDINVDLINVGLLKTSFRFYANDRVIGGEAGLGIEAYGLGINVISVGYQDNGFLNGFYMQSGIQVLMPQVFKMFKKSKS